MTITEFRTSIWASTLQACAEYPDQFNRSEMTMVREKFESNLHNLMHRPGEVNTDGEF